MQHGNLLGLGVVDDELGSRGALLVVAADGAEDEAVVLAVGQRGRRGRGSGIHHAFVVVDGSGSNGSARADRADHIADLAVDHAVGGHRALLGFAGVVHGHQLDLLAVDAASSVGHFNSGGSTFLDHVAILGQSAGGGDHQGDLDLCVSRCSDKCCTSQTQGCDQRTRTEGRLHSHSYHC
ncbi:hypothetical protein SDC9_135142 [bioreactor metagenome]|uniref:Uncharacterized protein n=1 Tax=bioreactor metagenome TaxID=1076179 RepID=A0A645DFL8_9ZZZZ